MDVDRRQCSLDRRQGSLDRRQVISAGIAALTIPGWFAACRQRGGDVGPGGPLGDALAEARAAGRPLLVLHVEDDPVRADDLGALVGTFLLYATDEQLAPMAACELACACSAELDQLSPVFARMGGVRAVLVPPGEAPFCAVSGEPPAVEWPAWDAQDGELVHEASVQARHAWLARQLRDAVGANKPALERRAAAERAAVGVSPAGALPDVQFARRWPCAALLRAELEPEQGAAWIEALASAARGRWGQRSPEGSTWAVSAGCGVEYEQPHRGMSAGVACGMGSVPHISQRFLHFFTAEELEG